MHNISFPLSPDTKRIWLPNEKEKDSYAEFTGCFDTSGSGQVFLQIACDSCYAVWLNGSLAAFSACADYPWYKLYDRVDITVNCREHNELSVQVWYFGEDSQTYLTGEPGLMFEVVQGGQVLLCSDQSILSRKNTCYRGCAHKLITSQLGFSFCYDNSAECASVYRNSAEHPAWDKLVHREAGSLRLLERAAVTVQEMQDGYLVDLGEETVGFLELDIVSPEQQSLLICFGEHLEEGRVPRFIGTRDFSVEFIAGAGENRYMNPFRRLAGRYLQIVCKKPIAISYVGLRPVEMPVSQRKVCFEDSLDQKIYDTSVNTLKKCMHEHYEDCPWREQAMYAMDSRNQMLCGYEAFRGTVFQKQNLLLIAQGQRSDGLLSLCFPAGLDFPIPFFSLVYLKQLEEYISYSADEGILQEVAPVVHRLMDAFTKRVEGNGLIANLPYPYWNFYEWEAESNHEEEITRSPTDPYEKQYDIILNAMYVHAAGIYNRLYGAQLDTEKTRKAIHETFYDRQKDLYRLSTKGVHFSRLGNSMALLIGLGDEALADKLLEDQSLIPVTLSMSTFFYDGLLRFGDRYRAWIVGDIRKKYKRMLDAGATTFWETEKGWQDFDGAGSLCHGWSAIPVYYLKKLLPFTES